MVSEDIKNMGTPKKKCTLANLKKELYYRNNMLNNIFGCNVFST